VRPPATDAGGKNADAPVGMTRQWRFVAKSRASNRAAPGTRQDYDVNWKDRPLPHPSPNSFHRFVTRALVASSMRISSGQWRVKPSVGHLRVASTPIFDP